MLSQPGSNGTISHGAIFVAGNTALPDPLRLEGDSTSAGWARVTDHPDGQQLGKKLAAAGWTFHYMAGAIRTTAFGFAGPGRIQAALQRLIASAGRQKCNCLEIDDIAVHSFLGMPYVSVSGHARHIQKDMVFSCQ